MTETIAQFLADMAREMLILIGVASLPLIVLILFRAGRMRGLTNENMNDRLGDLCYDTIKEKIREKIEELLNLYFNNAPNLPPGHTIHDIATHLHQDSESLQHLLPIFRNLTEFGIQSEEFQQILLFMGQ